MIKGFLQRFKKPTQAKLKQGDKISLKTPKNVLIFQGKNASKIGTIQPQDILTIYRQEDIHTLFSVAKNSQKKDKIKKGDIVTISNDSLINLQFKKL
jgi:hypothetical protein